MNDDVITGWHLLEDHETLRVARWRRGRFGFPVLIELPTGYSEEHDAKSNRGEPDPLYAVRAETMTTHDTSGEPHESEWWEEPYAGGPMVKVAGFPRVMYPPDAAPRYAPSSDGSDVTAYKRTVSRLGRWPWSPSTWDDSFSNAFSHGKAGGMVGDSGIAGVQRQGVISPDTGWIGQSTFNLLRSARVPEGLPHAGEMAMDGVAVNLINDAYARFTKPPSGSVNDVKAAVTDFCTRSIFAAAKWHYEQYREMRYLGVAPDKNHDGADCSEHATEAYYWARIQSNVSVPDPNHNGYNGYGYTGTLINNPKVTGSYQVGDLAIYGTSTSNTEHVTTCYAAGDVNTSEWCSNGSESAPYAVALRYRNDLLAVVRPGLMP